MAGQVDSSRTQVVGVRVTGQVHTRMIGVSMALDAFSGYNWSSRSSSEGTSQTSPVDDGEYSEHKRATACPKAKPAFHSHLMASLHDAGTPKS